MTTKHKYVLIYTDGRADNIQDGYDWVTILDYVNRRTNEGGSSSPIPNMLLRDGKIIVPEKIYEIAYEYVHYRQKLYDEAGARAKEAYPEPE